MVSIERPPTRLSKEYKYLFTEKSLLFLKEFVTVFEKDYDKIILQRQQTAIELKHERFHLEFKSNFFGDKKPSDWSISELPKKLINRKLDLGDCSPANTINFSDALNENLQGVQVDFDDGHCPTWKNQIQGLYNVCMATRSELGGMLHQIQESPLMLMRPRALNMIEHNCMINGRKVPGAFFDFALLMFHNGKILSDLASGPYFYLSKIESVEEALLWNKIFVWTQDCLGIPQGTIKACILIENILAAFCMDDILFAIKDHAIGLNCGIWDYSASIINKFGSSKDYLIPDRNKYVNVNQKFLKNYIKLVISTCHRHNAIATGGMAAKLLTQDPTGKESLEIIESVKASKQLEIELGVDGFLIYDLRLIPHMNKLWSQTSSLANQIHVIPDTNSITASSLLEIPKGGVTLNGIYNNIKVALLFIYHWLSGQGVFHLNLAVEDSATAEISRSQIWQWIHHQAPLEDSSNKSVTRNVVHEMLNDIISELHKSICTSIPDKKRLASAKYLLLDLISARYPQEFITTYLNDSLKFMSVHMKADGLKAKF